MSRPEVLIDGIVFENDSQIGIWRLFFEVMSRTSTDIQYTLLLATKPKQPVPAGVAVRRIGPRYDPNSRKQIPLKLWNWPFEKALQAKSPQAIWHSTFFGLDPRERTFKVVTVYDMAAERHYAHGPYVEQRARKARSLKEADVVLAISKATAKDLCDFYPNLADKIRVMHLGGEHLSSQQHSDAEKRPNVLREHIADEDYCLFVGGRYAYKNFGCVVESLASPLWPASLRLVVVGTPFDEAEQSFIRSKGVEKKIVHVGKVSHDLLETYFRYAKCFVFPSLIEGFGIPILEAQTLGTVPVLSDTTVFREVAGDGAIYFAPHSPNELAGAVSDSLVNERRSKVIQASLENIARFSWDETARIAVNCYTQLWDSSSESVDATRRKGES